MRAIYSGPHVKDAGVSSQKATSRSASGNGKTGTSDGAPVCNVRRHGVLPNETSEGRPDRSLGLSLKTGPLDLQKPPLDLEPSSEPHQRSVGPVFSAWTYNPNLLYPPLLYLGL